MEKPPYLKRGDKIVILSTARKISKEEIQPAIDELKSWGLDVVLAENLFKEDHQFSGNKQQRLSDLQNALDDKEIKAIMCARGGYGTVQLIDELNFSNFIKNPKWIIGYSDVTVLHNHVNQNYAIQTLHATMPINFQKNTFDSKESLRKALFGDQLIYEFAPSDLNIKGKAQGILVGGNLSIIYSLTGTNSQLDTAGKILFIEDLDEYLYHVDRMMMNIERAGMLSELKGLIVGGMSDMNDNIIPYGKTAIEIILGHVTKYNYPVCFNFPAGHLDDNRAIIMGEEVEINVGKNCCLSFSS